MRVVILASLAALTLSACGTQTIIANKRQAVIESWSHNNAVAQAQKACGSYGSWPMLERQSGAEYWFSCHETDETHAAREREQHQAALKRAQELRMGTESMSMPKSKPESKPVAKLAAKTMAEAGAPPSTNKMSKPRDTMAKGY
jgi:hypothetical protein